MKTKSYKYGKFTLKTYHKEVGHGYEVGLHFDKKSIFVGNFIHRTEANHWWSYMNKELRTFAKRYWVSPKAPKSWYTNFIKAHLYKKYYAYLDKVFSKYNRQYNTEFNKEQRRYRQLKKQWKPSEKADFHAKKAA
jgi:hypothetical protein